MSLLDSCTALVVCRATAQGREAWTDVGDDGAVRRSDLTRSDRKRQIFRLPGVDPRELSTKSELT